MNTIAVTELEKLYARFQRKFTVQKGSPELAQATQFSSNRSRPIHRWFHFKEGFAANIFTAAGINLEPLQREDGIFLDPFCGSGTTLLAGDLEYGWRANRIGVEINPFMAFVARTKVNWRSYNPSRFACLIDEILSQPLKESLRPSEWPALSTFHNSEIFSPAKISGLVDIVNRANNINELERDLLLLGIASAVDKVGFYRKDGRALRILRSEKEIERREALEVEAVIKDIWSTFLIDLKLLHEKRTVQISDSTVLHGDGRLIEIPTNLQLEPERVSLITYSPPYFNHIDYTEVYKIELWLLGFVKNQQEMLNLRKKTLRSHASINFTANGCNLPSSVRRAVNLAASEIETAESKWHQRFRDTAFGYLEDLHQSLTRQYEMLKPGGQVVCIVANSAHGSGSHRVTIAVDLFIASIAREIGFINPELLVSRQMHRRETINQYLRETVIILTKPR